MVEEKTLENDFLNAVNSIKQVKKVDTKTQLQLYGLYKQATIGDCNIKKPGIFDINGSAKYNAWNSCFSIPKSKAMSMYIHLVTTITDKVEKDDNDIINNDSVHVSYMRFTGNLKEDISYNENNIFDAMYIRDEDKAIDIIRHSSLSDDIFNVTTDENVSILHYAVDRELLNVIKCILSYDKGKDLVQSCDVYGDKPMDYAVLLENKEIINILTT